jgi:hypothetical protein
MGDACSRLTDYFCLQRLSDLRVSIAVLATAVASESPSRTRPTRSGESQARWVSQKIVNVVRHGRTPTSPAGSAAGQEQFTPEVRNGVDHSAGVWFNLPVWEHSFRSEKYDTVYSLLHLISEQI